METINCSIERTVFCNQENGYSVFQVLLKDSKNLDTLVGTFQGVTEGSVLIVNGEWKNNAKYGRQFIANTWREEMPVSAVGMEKYLASGLIKGIGQFFAKRIVSHFGIKTFEVLDKNPEWLLDVEGIGKGRMEKIRRSWEEHKGINDIMVYLQGFGVNTAYAIRIYKQYGNESIEKVKENPYALADDIFGIGFKTADTIAEKLGYGRNDLRRCKAGIIYTLNQLSKDGHCFVGREQLVKSALELLSADEQPISEAIDILDFEQGIVIEGDNLFLPNFYYSECGVANKLKRLLEDENDLSEDCNIEKISEDSGIEYDEVQVAAIKQAVKSKVMVLTGGPGTGKTTTTLGIIAALESLGNDIQCAAPTGRAAKRMSEATGKSAKTIHRLLEYKPQEGYRRNEKNPLDGDVLIIDESSMIDITLMNSLLKAVREDMRLILVGDIDQLPSVGAGNVLRDIIDSKAVPVVRLTRIFRQAQSSRIVTNAHKINHGEFPDISNGMDTDFFFIGQENGEVAATEIVNIVKNRIPKAYGYGIDDIQVLTPMKNGAVGTTNLNILLQEAINPEGESLTSGAYKYRKGDKVMQIKNNYDKNVFNGDIGTVESVDTEDGVVTVMFDKSVEYERGEMNELTLSYACTIHKSQGSEYPVVVMPLMMSHYVMLQRNLVYTGITRAKKICIIVGEKKALAQAVRNMVVLKRNTMLKNRLINAD